jgi:hypothetical protein
MCITLLFSSSFGSICFSGFCCCYYYYYYYYHHQQQQYHNQTTNTVPLGQGLLFITSRPALWPDRTPGCHFRRLRDRNVKVTTYHPLKVTHYKRPSINLLTYLTAVGRSPIWMTLIALTGRKKLRATAKLVKLLDSRYLITSY